MSNLVFLTTIFLMCGSLLYGQDAGPYFHHLTVEDGLSEGTNHNIYKDSKGFIWLGSLNGLNRYDGRQVNVYKYNPDDSTSVYGQIIQSPIFETKNHDLWFSTYEGLNCYDRKQDKFRHFLLENKDGEQLFSFYVFHLDENDNLWVIVDGLALYHFHITSEKFIFKHELNQPMLRATAVTDGSGVVKEVLYLGFVIPGIYSVEYNNGEITGAKFQLGDDSDTPVLVEKVILKEDEIWMATTAGLALFDPLKEKLQYFYSSPSAMPESCISIERLDENRLLVAIKGKGIFIFNIKKRIFTKNYTAAINDPHSLSNNDPDEIYVDPDGGVWISFNNLGVDFFHPEKQKFYSLRPDPAQLDNAAIFNVVAMVEDENGNVWCGNSTGGIAIYNFRNRTFEWKKKTDNSTSRNPLARVSKLFRDSKNRIWILGWQGIAVWLPDEKRLLALPEIEGRFLDGCQLRSGKIVLAKFDGGLFELAETKGEFKVDEISNIDKKYSFVSLWEDSNGRLFACESLKELWVIEPEKSFKVFQKLPIQGISFSFCERPGDPAVWIANSYGLIQLTLLNGKYEYVYYTEKQGLPSSAAYSVLAGNDGKLWIGTGKGIASFDPKNVTFRNYGIVDGVSALQFNGFPALKRKDGQLMLGSTNGITSFYPEKVKSIAVQAHPVITKILINDQEDSSLVCEKTGAKNYSEIDSLYLDYQRNTITFNFAPLEYSYPKETRFRYKLQGVDPDWVEIGNENLARYAKIPPGRYVFSMKASNSDGIWSESRNLSIYIKPPFTQTIPFYILMGLAGFGLVSVVVFLRQRRLQKNRQLQEEKRLALEFERQRIARDVHDDLGSGLSALSLLTEIAKYKNSKEELKGEIEKINLASRDLSGKIREVIWTVNAKNDTLANLISYLHLYALELLENAGIDHHVNLPNIIPEANISGEYRRTLFLAFKEALNNILKHANAGKVEIDFSAEAEKLQISVKDNGKGFDPALLVSSTGNGLLNMQSRMRDIQCECEFKTSNRGTEVIFLLKLASK